MPDIGWRCGTRFTRRTFGRVSAGGARVARTSALASSRGVIGGYRLRWVRVALAVTVSLLCAASTVQPVAPAATGVSQPQSMVVWGDTAEQMRAPGVLSDVVAVAAGGDQGMVLLGNGTVIGWGGSYSPSGPNPLDVPVGLSGVTAISAGWVHDVALKADGTVVAWGEDGSGQIDVPAGLSGVTAIAAGATHTLALKSDGTVIGWGDDSQGELDIPAGLHDAVAVSAGAGQSMALRADGTVLAWGVNTYGQSTVPPGLGPVTTISAGNGFDVALKSDGTVTAWGQDNTWQTQVPAGLNHVVAISAGWNHSLALKSDGTVVAWGSDYAGQQMSVPAGLNHVGLIAAGTSDSFALVTDTGPYSALVDSRASLLAHWRLGEVSGVTALDTTGRYNGTYSGNAVLGVAGALNGKGWLGGDFDTAAAFNGATSKVAVPALPSVGDFTIEGWSYLGDTAATNNTVYGGANSVRILARPGTPKTSTTAYAGVSLNGTEYTLQPHSTASNRGTWVQWVLTRQGSALTLYRDGIQVGQRTDLPATAPANINGAIGAQSNGSYPLHGGIDEVAVYSGALSPTDVADDYRSALFGGTPPPSAAPAYRSAVLSTTSVVCYWRLGEASGTAAVDSKGTHTGTYSNVLLGAAGAIRNDRDTSATFNGSTSKASVPALGLAGDFTLEGWTYLTNGASANNTLFGSIGTVRLLARPGATTAAYAGVWLNGIEYALQPTSAASNLNTWVYWALTRHTNTLTLYRDGAQIGQRADLPPTAQANVAGWIGAQGGTTYPLAGRIDEVAIYNSALAAPTITNHWIASYSGTAP